MPKSMILAIIALSVSGCAIGAPPTSQAASDRSARRGAVPIERKTVVKLRSRYALDVGTQPVRGDTTVTISNVDLTTYGGQAIIVDGPKMPSGVPMPAGVKKLLFAVTFTFSQPLQATGSWTIGLQGNLRCTNVLATAGFYSPGTGWQTNVDLCGGNVYIFPTWTTLKSHATYVAALFTS